MFARALVCAHARQINQTAEAHLARAEQAQVLRAEHRAPRSF
jgi:hypothetical protein